VAGLIFPEVPYSSLFSYIVSVELGRIAQSACLYVNYLSWSAEIGSKMACFGENNTLASVLFDGIARHTAYGGLSNVILASVVSALMILISYFAVVQCISRAPKGGLVSIHIWNKVRDRTFQLDI
jgi:uncharacterized iron-regulated membrane protein